jgi:nucleotide-binding universal stress UspA family protein
MTSANEGGPIVACVDGSEASTRAVAAGLELVAGDAPIVVVTVAEPTDPMLVSGSGLAGGVLSPEELEVRDRDANAAAQAVAQEAADALGRTGAEIAVARGEPGPALCAFASDRAARALVMGTRGRSGIKRALLGSVSDYVVRNAPCPVVITNPRD